MRNALLFWMAIPAIALTVAGCGADFAKETAPVSGKVTCNGEMVTEGYIVFTPVVQASADPKDSGKSGYATIESDGTYVITTYDDGDGAVIGMHEVRIYKPDPEDDEQIVEEPFVCGEHIIMVTVEDDDNVIDLDPATMRQ